MKMPVSKLLNMKMDLWLLIIALEEVIHSMQRSYKQFEDKASHIESPWLLMLVAMSADAMTCDGGTNDVCRFCLILKTPQRK
jgi:hypothetical protein